MYNDALMGQRAWMLIRQNYGTAKRCCLVTGKSPITVSKMQKPETHKGSMRIDTIARIADSLGTSIDYLVGRIDKDPEKAQYARLITRMRLQSVRFMRAATTSLPSMLRQTTPGLCM